MAKEESSKRKVKILAILIFSFFLFSLLPVGKSAGADVTNADASGPMILDGDYPITISETITLSAGSQLPPGMSKQGYVLLSWPVLMEENDVWWCLYRGDNLIEFQQAKIDTISLIAMNAWLIQPPDLQIPAFATPGSYHFILMYNSGEYDDWWKNVLWWFTTWIPDITIIQWNFNVGESSLQDNMFAPYVIFIDDIGGKPYNIIIPCPIFIILAVVFFIFFIKFIVPLWLHIPKAAKWDLNKYRNRKVKKL